MSPARMSKIESGTRLVLEFGKAFNRQDVAAMAQFLCEDCVLETGSPAPDGAVYRGRAAAAGYWQALFRELPGAHLEIEEVFGIGLRCVMRWKLAWAGDGGEAAHLRGIDVFEMREGLIYRMFTYVKG